MIGERKGEGLLGCLFGILLGPVGLLFVIFSRGNRKTCPYCKELVHKDATHCSHCQKELEVETKNSRK